MLRCRPCAGETEGLRVSHGILREGWMEVETMYTYVPRNSAVGFNSERSSAGSSALRGCRSTDSYMKVRVDHGIVLLLRQR